LQNIILIDTSTIIISKDRRSFERLMENLHRKEHETSATIAEAGGLAVRIIVISAPSDRLY
jgi:hypothetical protein